MKGWTELDRFLRTDPRDVGCERALAILHIYADLKATGATTDPRFAGVEAHLAACGPCSEDFQGLLAAIHTLEPDTET